MRDRRWRQTDLDRVPAAAGVYAIFSGTRLVYIGSAVHMRERLNDHGVGRSWKRGPGRFSALPQLRLKVALAGRPGEHLAREFRLITRLRPPENRNHAGGRRGLVAAAAASSSRGDS